jgi:hypothetical protein
LRDPQWDAQALSQRHTDAAMALRAAGQPRFAATV